MVLTPSEITEYTSYVQLAFVHTYTRSAVVEGSEDSWKMGQPTYPVSVTGLVCNYLSEGVLNTREEGVVSVETPSIMVPASDTIKVGDRVTDIRDSNGVVVIAGPLYVTERATAMGFGPLTNYVCSLQGSAPTKW